MSYTFTQPEINLINTAYSQGLVDGNYEAFYSQILSILNDAPGHGGSAPGNLPDVIKSRIWIEGALKVNTNKGSFAEIIREYAIKQGQLHYDRTFTSVEIQDASNEVAIKFYETLSGTTHNWTIPNIDIIAIEDLKGVSEILFNVNTADSVFLNNTAWPGTLLLSKLRDQADFTENLIAIGDAASADNLDDWRNVTYANHSYNYAASEALVNSGYELIDLTGFNLTSDLRTIWELYWLEGEGELPLTVGKAVKGLAAEEAFAPVINYGEISVVHMLNGASQGYFENPTFDTIDDYFHSQVRSFFGGPGVQNHSIPAVVNRVDNLIYQAQVDIALAQNSLQSLSIFKVGATANSIPGFSYQYWYDKGQMTKARLAYDAQFNLFGTLQNTGGYVESSVFDNKPMKFTDLQTGVIFKVKPYGINAAYNEVIFGSDGDNSLSGNTQDDHLYGLDGADSLSGGLGDDFLSGGSGFDSYLVNSGNDTIFDSDGAGSVALNGEILTGGDLLGGNVWDSVDGRFRYQYLSTPMGNQLLVNDSSDPDGSLEISHFENGDLGITLVDFTDPIASVDYFAPPDYSTLGVNDYYSFSSSDNDLFEAGLDYDLVNSGSGDDIVLLSDGVDRALTGFGNDVVHGEEGKDYIIAGVGFNNLVNGPIDKDTVIGGNGVDLINTGVGNDLIIAALDGEDINAGNTSDQGDWLVADEGNDVVYGSINQDFITAGAGGDLVYAGGGFDVILADGDYVFTRSVATVTPVTTGSYEHTWNGSSWDSAAINYALLTPGDAFIFSTSITSGGDYEFIPAVTRTTTDRVQDVPSVSNNDEVHAGPGPDWVAGGPGSDKLYGDADDDIIYGDDLVALPTGSVYGNDSLFGGSGQDLLFGNQGDDILRGGSDDDMLFGDDSGEPSGHDFLYGDDGIDELYGLGGDDYLSGGAWVAKEMTL